MSNRIFTRCSTALTLVLALAEVGFGAACQGPSLSEGSSLATSGASSGGGGAPGTAGVGGGSASATSSVSVSVSSGGGAGGAGGGTVEADILEKLQAIPGLQVTEKPSKIAGYRRFLLQYDQPADHEAPSGQRFTQRLVLEHRSSSAPLVLSSTGYGISFSDNAQYLSEPTELLEANELRVEHRFFSPSRPEPASWDKLTIAEAAADHHRIATAFKPLYPAKWISTGGSKGGMTSVYHRRFYPGDVDGTVAYVAPESYGTADPRYLTFLEKVGSDPACRDALKAFQANALSRRPAMLKAMAAQGASYNILGPERAFEYAIIELPFTFWQYSGASRCPDIPGPSATNDEVWSFLDEIDGPSFWSDAILLEFEPYYFQAGTELGYPAYADGYIASQLMYAGSDVPASFVVPGPGKTMTFHPEAMKDVASWLATEGKAMLFVYGEVDPYSAAAFELGGAKDSYRFFVPGGTHGSEIADLPSSDQATAKAALFKWAGVTPKGVLGPSPFSKARKAARRMRLER